MIRTCSVAAWAGTSHHAGNMAGHGDWSAGEGADQAVTAVEPAPSGKTWTRPLALVDGHPVSVGDIRARPPRRRAAGLPVTGRAPLYCNRDKHVLQSVIQPPHERSRFCGGFAMRTALVLFRPHASPRRRSGFSRPAAAPVKIPIALPEVGP